jgi:hypothetical protein
MKYLVFNTEQEALAKENEISENMGYAKAGTNALTGDIVLDVLTLRWDTPRQISDGRWVIVSPNDEGIENEDDWFTFEEYDII